MFESGPVSGDVLGSITANHFITSLRYQGCQCQSFHSTMDTAHTTNNPSDQTVLISLKEISLTRVARGWENYRQILDEGRAQGVQGSPLGRYLPYGPGSVAGWIDVHGDVSIPAEHICVIGTAAGDGENTIYSSIPGFVDSLPLA